MSFLGAEGRAVTLSDGPEGLMHFLCPQAEEIVGETCLNQQDQFLFYPMIRGVSHLLYPPVEETVDVVCLNPQDQRLFYPKVRKIVMPSLPPGRGD